MKATQAYAEIWSEVLATNRYLKVALGAMAVVSVALAMLCWRTFDRFENLSPLVLRINEVGRAEAVAYDTVAYRPDIANPEVKYFLRRFLVLHRERRRGAALEGWKQSLLFLDDALARRMVADQEASGELAGFLVGEGSEIEVEVGSVQVQPSREEPYTARLDFSEVRRDGTGRALERMRWTSKFEFRFLTKPPRELLPVNPTGLSISYFRCDRVVE